MLRLSLSLCVLLLLAASCDKLGQWKSSQVQQSHQIAQGSKITPSASPPSVPSSVREQLPLDDSFTVLTYSKSDGSVNLTALSPWDAEQTALWLVSRLNQQGYDSGDNASRLLDGATYQRASGDFHTLYVKLSLNTSKQCTVEYRASS